MTGDRATGAIGLGDGSVKHRRRAPARGPRALADAACNNDRGDRVPVPATDETASDCFASASRRARHPPRHQADGPDGRAQPAAACDPAPGGPLSRFGLAGISLAVITLAGITLSEPATRFEREAVA